MGDTTAGGGAGAPGFDSRAVYEAAAADYAAVARRWWGFVAESAVRSLRLAPGERVLDAACGTGLATLSAAHRVGPDGRVVGVDHAPAMLAEAAAAAREQGLANVELRLGDVTALDPDLRDMDAVVCSLGLFFVDDMAALAADLWGRLRPGGRLAVGVFGDGVFAPLVDELRAAVAEEGTGTPVAPPWERIGGAAALATILEDGGVEGAVITEVRRLTPLSGPEEAWRVVMGSALRRHVEDAGPSGAAALRERTLAGLRRRGADALATTALVAVAERPGSA